MIRIFIILFVSFEALHGVAPERTVEDLRIESDQVALWQQKLAEAKQREPKQKLELLWLGLRNMGHRRSIDGHSPEVDRIFKDLQSELLSIPGHARHFADEVERIRSEGKDPGDERYRYYAETLPHLPSPETVSVLGELLYDMRDKQVHGECTSSLGESAWLAFGVLQKLGVRGLPIFERTRILGATPGPGETWTHQQHLDAEREAIQKSIARAELQLEEYRSWWQDVKSGKRTFSFKGQSVEHRFKPDGTWETLAMAHPPDDGPGRPEAGEKRPERKRTMAGQVADQANPDHRWMWPAISAILLIAVAIGRLLLKRQRPSAGSSRSGL